MECYTKNSSTAAVLRERECPLCEAGPGNCRETEQRLTEDCETDPLDRTWEKYCRRGEETGDQKTKFLFDGSPELRGEFTADDLIQESVGPVEQLILETLQQISVQDLQQSGRPVIITSPRPNTPATPATGPATPATVPATPATLAAPVSLVYPVTSAPPATTFSTQSPAQVA